MPLFEEELVLILPERHAWVKRRTVRVSELGDEPLMVMPAGFYTRQMIDDAFRAAGIAPRIAVEMNSIAAIVATVQRGGHATILPRLAISDRADARAVGSPGAANAEPKSWLDHTDRQLFVAGARRLLARDAGRLEAAEVGLKRKCGQSCFGTLPERLYIEAAPTA